MKKAMKVKIVGLQYDEHKITTGAIHDDILNAQCTLQRKHRPSRTHHTEEERGEVLKREKNYIV